MFRHRSICGFAALWLATILSNAEGQTQSRQLVTSSSRLLTQTVPCGWMYMWDPPDRFADIDVTLVLGSNGRSFSAAGNGQGGYAYVEVTLDGTYLPTTTFTCGSAGIIMGPSSYYEFPWVYPEQPWTNSSCDGYPPVQFALWPTSTYWISEELQNTSQVAVSGVQDGSHYWSNVGDALSFPALTTDPGGAVGFYPETLGPLVPGAYNAGSRTISLNTPLYYGFNSDQWAYIAAHELGHAIGLGHVSSGDSVMIFDSGGASGATWPKTLDKCATVQHYAVPIQIGG